MSHNDARNLIKANDLMDAATHIVAASDHVIAAVKAMPEIRDEMHKSYPSLERAGWRIYHAAQKQDEVWPTPQMRWRFYSILRRIIPCHTDGTLYSL